MASRKSPAPQKKAATAVAKIANKVRSAVLGPKDDSGLKKKAAPSRTRAAAEKAAGPAAKASTRASKTSKGVPAKAAAAKPKGPAKAAAGTGTKAAARPKSKAPARKLADPEAGGSPARERSRRKVEEEGPRHDAALAAAQVAADAALDKKAENVVILDVAGLNSYADCFVIASGTSDRQVGAIADSIEEKMKKAGHRTIGVEGHGLGHWILLDYGDVVVHVFYDEIRGHFDVEGLWSDAKRIQVG